MRPNTIAGPSGAAYRYERMGVYFRLYQIGEFTPIAEGKLDKLSPGSPINKWWVRKAGDRLWLRTDAMSEVAAIEEAAHLVDGWRQSPARSGRAAQFRNISID